jgi:hypothetical protein
MKTSTELCRGAAVVMTSLLLAAGTQAAPEKPAPAPAAEQQPSPQSSTSKKKKGSLTKKSAAAPASKTDPAPADTASAKRKSAVPAKDAKSKTAGAPEAAPPPPPPEKKKGFLKGLFGKKKDTEEQAVEPALAKAKTAKPVPVKDVKPVKPAPTAAVAPAVAEEPKKKRGIFGFLKGNRAQEENFDSAVPDAAKIAKPADWQDHRVVKEESVGLYEFGPSQSNGPDIRLGPGTMVKIQKVERGWALVQTTAGRSGYVDASTLRNAVEGDFAMAVMPVIPATASASLSPKAWAPAAPPPDLPDSPATLDTESGLLLLPPLELEPKKQ